MEDAPFPIIQNPKEIINTSFEIKQEEKNYKLNMKVINQKIILNILEEKDLMKEYEIKLNFDELKNYHKIFLTFSSWKDFNDFIKATIENNKILIKQNKENQITIEIMIEYIFKQNIIKFDLNQKKISSNLSTQDLYQKFTSINQICKNIEMNYKKVIEDNNNIKEENNKIKENIESFIEDNNKLKEEIKNIKEDNKILKQEKQKLNDEKLKIEKKLKILKMKIRI